MTDDRKVLVRVEDLKKHFPITSGIIFSRRVGAIKAVDGISFDIHQGETLGLVGESGCGKSTTGRVILQLYRPSSGRVFFQGMELTALSDGELRLLRPKMQMIFQDSYAALNPRHSVGKIVGEPMVIHGVASGRELKERVAELLALVGLNPAWVDRYPHEFSALHPSFIVCDEPVSALDVSIQAQVVNLLQELQERLGLTYLFIAHDLSMVQHISSRVAVMYLGKIVELASRDELFDTPLHPYTQSLMSAVPVPNPKVERKRRRIILKGDVPSPAHPPEGCVFSTRCPLVIDECSRIEPEYRAVRLGHFVACHRVGPGW